MVGEGGPVVAEATTPPPTATPLLARALPPNFLLLF